MAASAQRPGSVFTPDSQRGPRWWRYVNSRQLMCPAGHHFKNVVRINESGFIQCVHWINADQVEGSRRGHECALWVFVMPIRGGKAIVVEVSQGDADAMGELQSPAAMLDYLGIFEPSALMKIGAPAGGRA